MITKLSIRNFKSIKELDIDCGSGARPYVIKEYDNILMITNFEKNECGLDYIVIVKK